MTSSLAWWLVLLCVLLVLPKSESETVNDTLTQAEGTNFSSSPPTFLIDGPPRKDDGGWGIPVLRHGLILVVSVLVVLAAIVIYRYSKSVRRKPRAGTSRYNKLNTEVGDTPQDGEIEMSIYEKH